MGQTEFVLNYDYNVPQNHLVRLINAFVDSIPQEVLLEENVAVTGRPLPHPALMLKNPVICVLSSNLFWPEN
ncbi:hypothetical protein AALA17_01490 [Lactobacillaceae bacterium 24-114]